MKYDFRTFGQAIKEARKAKGISRNQLADRLSITSRYIASIKNSEQYPGLRVFYELVTLLDISVGQLLFLVKIPDKTTQRRQFDELLNGVDETDLVIVTGTVKGIQKTEKVKEAREAGE